MRWWFKTPQRRLWLIAVYGVAAAISSISISQPIAANVIEAAVFLIGSALALVGLGGYGPLRVRPDPAASDVDQLVGLAQRWRSGELSQEELEVAKRQIIER